MKIKRNKIFVDSYIMQYNMGTKIQKRGLLCGNSLVYGKNSYSNRKHKGKSLLEWVDNYVLVDIETTGLSPRTDEIIEIGAIKVKENKIIGTYNTLLKIDRHLNPFITKLTGITNEMLKEGKEQGKALEEFIKFAGKEIIMGHNVNFDINFIYDKCESYLDYYLSNDFVDTMRIAKHILPDVRNYKLGTLADYFDVDYRNAHRGLIDVEITYEVYNKMKNLANKLLQKDNNFTLL